MPEELVLAYREDEEEFFGCASPEQEPTIDSDEFEEELGDRDSDNDDITTQLSTTFTAFQDGDEVIIQDQDIEKQAVIDQFQNGCGCMNNCYQQFSVDEMFHIRL